MALRLKIQIIVVTKFGDFHVDDFGHLFLLLNDTNGVSQILNPKPLCYHEWVSEYRIRYDVGNVLVSMSSNSGVTSMSLKITTNRALPWWMSAEPSP